VTIEIENYGTIKAELYGKTVPITVENFVSLAESGFYEGLTFHRIISGFMMQGGAPNSDSPKVQPIKGEFSSNGVTNNLLHERGVLSMARTSEPDSASSQFFIMHQTSPHLDGDYAAFGKVIEGIEVVDAICTSVKPSGGNGAIAAADRPVIKSMTVEKVS
jgi:peptidyl-prolyl cis-trans isomerase B (cyclophilin B)